MTCMFRLSQLCTPPSTQTPPAFKRRSACAARSNVLERSAAQHGAGKALRHQRRGCAVLRRSAAGALGTSDRASRAAVQVPLGRLALASFGNPFFFDLLVWQRCTLVHFGAVVADAPSPLSTPRCATGQAQLRLGKPLRMKCRASPVLLFMHAGQVVSGTVGIARATVPFHGEHDAQEPTKEG